MGQLIGPGILIIKLGIATVLTIFGCYLLFISRDKLSEILGGMFGISDLEASPASFYFCKFVGLVTLGIGLIIGYFMVISPMLNR